jgi:hypothetical protein
VHDDGDDGEDDEEVDEESTDVHHEKAADPKDEKYDCKYEKHFVLLSEYRVRLRFGAYTTSD